MVLKLCSVKYAMIQVFSDLFFRIRIDSVFMRENMGQSKLVFWYILHSAKLNSFASTPGL